MNPYTARSRVMICIRHSSTQRLVRQTNKLIPEQGDGQGHAAGGQSEPYQAKHIVPRIPNQSLLSPPSPTVFCIQPSIPSSKCYFQAPPQSGCPTSLLAPIFSPGGACLPLSIQGAAGQLTSVSTAFSTDRSCI